MKCEHWIKLIGLAIILSICVYQVEIVIEKYYRYETVVGAEFYIEEEIPDYPAITFCPYTWINKTAFCNAYPKPCEDSFIENEIRKIYYETLNGTEKVAYQMHANGFFESCSFKMGNGSVSDSKICQHPLERWQRMYMGDFLCFVLDISDYFSDSNFLNEIKSFHSKVVVKDGFYPDYQNPSIFIYIHDRFNVPKFGESLTMIENVQSCEMKLTKTVVKNLEAPYKTNCWDYQKHFLNNDKKGYQSNSMCSLKCESDMAKSICGGCVPANLRTDPKEPECQRSLLCERKNEFLPLISECQHKCLIDCDSVYYEQTLLCEELISDRPEIESKIDLRTHGNIKYVHSASLSVVEVFAYAGGYMSFWLGVSVPAFSDFIHYRLKIYLNKRKLMKNPRYVLVETISR